MSKIIIGGHDFSTMENLLIECPKRIFKSNLKEWEGRYQFNTIQKSIIEKLKISRGIK